MKRIYALLLIAIFLDLSAYAQESRKEKKARLKFEMAQLIHSGKFKFVAQSAQSELGNFNNLGSNYDLIFDSLEVKAYLPYFGRAYSAPYGGSGGVKFNLTTTDMLKSWNEKKKLYTISAKLSDSTDSYIIYLTTGLDGYADVRITFNNRGWISYFGIIEKIDPEK